MLGPILGGLETLDVVASIPTETCLTLQRLLPLYSGLVIGDGIVVYPPPIDEEDVDVVEGTLRLRWLDDRAHETSDYGISPPCFEALEDGRVLDPFPPTDLSLEPGRVSR